MSVLHPPCWTYGLSFPDLPLSLASDLSRLPCGLPGQFEDHVRRVGKLSSAIALADYIVFGCFQEKESLSPCTDSLLEGILYQIMNVLPVSPSTVNLILILSSQICKLFLSLLSLPACFLCSDSKGISFKYHYKI